MPSAIRRNRQHVLLLMPMSRSKCLECCPSRGVCALARRVSAGSWGMIAVQQAAVRAIKSGRQGESMMKRLLLATVGLVALCTAGTAMAADMAVKAPPPAPIVPIYNWTGFYIGGNGGWAQNHNCVDFLDAAGVAA